MFRGKPKSALQVCVMVLSFVLAAIVIAHVVVSICVPYATYEKTVKVPVEELSAESKEPSESQESDATEGEEDEEKETKKTQKVQVTVHNSFEDLVWLDYEDLTDIGREVFGKFDFAKVGINGIVMWHVLAILAAILTVAFTVFNAKGLFAVIAGFLWGLFATLDAFLNPLWNAAKNATTEKYTFNNNLQTLLIILSVAGLVIATARLVPYIINLVKTFKAKIAKEEAEEAARLERAKQILK